MRLRSVVWWPPLQTAVVAAAWWPRLQTVALRLRRYATQVMETHSVLWMVATDNSPGARHALDVTLSLMAREDRVVCIFLSRYE